MTNLHSTMVKFKSSIIFSRARTALYIYIPLWSNSNLYFSCFATIYLHIYIPLWSNSNYLQRSWDIIIWLHLHSTMVKFKSENWCKSKPVVHIYIPLWSNSNFIGESSTVADRLIYIPLWSNSNKGNQEYALRQKGNLHSTMVKFKSVCT